MKILEALTPIRKEHESKIVNQKHPLYTVDEKRRLLLGRNGILYLPPGVVIPKVARKVGVSRQHVHATLFPDDPTKLFGTSLASKLIWTETADLVFSSPLYLPLTRAFAALKAKGEVVLKARRGIVKFFLERATDLGMEPRVKDTSSMFCATHWIVNDLVIPDDNL